MEKEQNPRVHVTLRMPVSMLKQVDEAAKDRMTSRSSIILLCVKGMIKKLRREL